MPRANAPDRLAKASPDAMPVPWWCTQLHSEEADAAGRAVADGRLSSGPDTRRLEETLGRLLEVPFVSTTTSGSTALLIALKACGVGAGDEVIVANRTFIATAHAVLLSGADVCLVDTLEHMPLIDPDEVRLAVTPRTKAIICIHLNGRSCQIRELRQIADAHGIFLIEDAAQALFSRSDNDCLGTLADVGCFSFGVTKLLTSGQGGAIVTRRPELHERILRYQTHGVSDPRAEDFLHFGFNFRFTDIQAGIMLEQLKRCEEKMAAHMSLYRRYAEAVSSLRTVRMLEVDLERGELPLWIEVVCTDRDGLINHLAQMEIDARKATPCLNLSPHLATDRSFPRSRFFMDSILTLPSGPDQSPTGIDRTLEALAEFDTEVR